MATETLNLNVINANTDWTGVLTDVDEAISAADGNSMDPIVDDAVIDFGVTDSSVVDANTVTRIDIVVRGKKIGSNGDRIKADLLIGGVAQGSSSNTGNLSTSFVDYTLNDVGWNVDRSASDMDGLEVRLTVEATGMPHTPDVQMNCVDVNVIFSTTQNFSIVGDVPYTITPAATLVFTGGFVILGDVPYTVTMNATMQFQQHPSIIGDVPYAITPAATLQFQQHPSIIGALTYDIVPAATLDFQIHPAIIGDLTYAITPSATLQFARHFAIVGDLTYGWTPLATLQFQQNPSVIGDITYNVSVNATLQFQQHPSIAGSLTYDLAMNAILSKSTADFDAAPQRTYVMEEDRIYIVPLEDRTRIVE